MGKIRPKTEENDIILPKESVTLAEVFGLLAFLLIIIVGTLFYLRYSKYSILADFFGKKIPAFSIESILSRDQNKAVGDKVEFKITEKELNELSGIASGDIPLKKPELKITGDGVIVSGKYGNAWLGVPVEAVMVPKAENGQLNFEIKEIKAAGVVAPPKIKDSLQPTISRKFAGLFAGKKINVTYAKAMTGFLLIEGTNE